MREKIAKEQQIEQLARDLEKPRAIRLLAEWIAIDKGETRLQGDKYIQDAEGLYDYLTLVGFRLVAWFKQEIEKLGVISDEKIAVIWASFHNELEQGFPSDFRNTYRAENIRQWEGSGQEIAFAQRIALAQLQHDKDTLLRRME